MKSNPQRARQPRKNPAAGFTLVELMMVLALIGIFTGMIVAEMRGTHEEALLRAAARKVAGLCETAGSRSIALNLPHAVRLDTAKGRFAVAALRAGRAEGGGAPANIAEEGELDGRISILVREPAVASANAMDEGVPDGDGEAPAPPADALIFYADGTAEPREIVLKDRTGVELLLRVNPVTGGIRILDSPQPTAPPP